MDTRGFTHYKEREGGDLVEALIVALLIVGFELGSALFSAPSSDGYDWADPDAISRVR